MSRLQPICEGGAFPFHFNPFPSKRGEGRTKGNFEWMRNRMLLRLLQEVYHANEIIHLLYVLLGNSNFQSLSEITRGLFLYFSCSFAATPSYNKQQQFSIPGLMGLFRLILSLNWSSGSCTINEIKLIRQVFGVCVAVSHFAWLVVIGPRGEGRKEGSESAFVGYSPCKTLLPVLLLSDSAST